MTQVLVAGGLVAWATFIVGVVWLGSRYRQLKNQRVVADTKDWVWPQRIDDRRRD